MKLLTTSMALQKAAEGKIERVNASNSLDSCHCEIGGSEGDLDSDPAGASNYS